MTELEILHRQFKAAMPYAPKELRGYIRNIATNLAVITNENLGEQDRAMARAILPRNIDLYNRMRERILPKDGSESR